MSPQGLRRSPRTPRGGLVSPDTDEVDDFERAMMSASSGSGASPKSSGVNGMARGGLLKLALRKEAALDDERESESEEE